jgi:hypothetical protein
MRPQFKILVIMGAMVTAGLGAAVPASDAAAAPVMDTSILACSGSACQVGPGNVGVPFAAGLNVIGDGAGPTTFTSFTNPGSVTVTDSLGGSATIPVTVNLKYS